VLHIDLSNANTVRLSVIGIIAKLARCRTVTEVNIVAVDELRDIISLAVVMPLMVADVGVYIVLLSLSLFLFCCWCWC